MAKDANRTPSGNGDDGVAGSSSVTATTESKTDVRQKIKFEAQTNPGVSQDSDGANRGYGVGSYASPIEIPDSDSTKGRNGDNQGYGVGSYASPIEIPDSDSTKRRSYASPVEDPDLIQQKKAMELTQAMVSDPTDHPLEYPISVQQKKLSSLNIATELTQAMVSDPMHHPVEDPDLIQQKKATKLTQAMVSDPMHHAVEDPDLIQQKVANFSKHGLLNDYIVDMLCGPGSELPAKLRSTVEPYLIERITSEIMHKKLDVRWEDIAWRYIYRKTFVCLLSAGLQYAKKCVTEMVVWPLLRPDIFKGCRSPGRGLLLFGPPGTGKTMIGKAIAGEAKATFFYISASSVLGKWMGESEKLVRALFGVASCRQPAVIFVDEIDSLLSQRSDREHDTTRRIKTQFLIEMEGCDTGSEQILLIGEASNLNSKETLVFFTKSTSTHFSYCFFYDILSIYQEQRIDHKTLMRQLGGDLPSDFIFHSLPQANHRLVGCKEARAWIVRNLLEKDGLFKLSNEDIDTICKSTEGYSGSDMKNLVKDASMGPLREAFTQGIEITNLKKKDLRAVTLQDFENSLQEVRPSVSPNELGSYEDWNTKFGSFPPSTMQPRSD
ncbi:hypothetical protein OSB04_026859 [Centaurea solstitialis]|uniref:AAA+ ATPase domain-containing protein n=1 Tax=Centaurea solstitialis TaxID=347529 RepID=A0AA38SXP8_9ASTR|nr:hypothetical protein OSB04_026859 [Centaurea solstitialis]